MEIILKDGVKFIRHSFDLENQFEKIVLMQYKSIFGENAILFDKQKIKTATGIGTIPDAFVISPGKRKWYIVEVELAVHNVYQHIIPQITKFKNALENVHTRRTLTKFFDSSIENDLSKLASWVSATDDKNVFRLLSEILDEEPQLLIIIDDKNEELEIASKNLPFATRINIFKTFCREGFGLGDNIFQFDTFTSAKKITKEKFLESTPNEQTFERQTTQREPGKKRSPSAPEWIQQIPELSGLKGLYKWTDLCDHFNLRHQGNSARRVFQKWVERNKPNWVAVPDA
jgi:hypothetical protein